jgi:hypothetical protein
MTYVPHVLNASIIIALIMTRVVWYKLTSVSELHTAYITRAMMMEVINTSETPINF